MATETIHLDEVTGRSARYEDVESAPAWMAAIGAVLIVAGVAVAAAVLCWPGDAPEVALLVPGAVAVFVGVLLMTARCGVAIDPDTITLRFRPLPRRRIRRSDVADVRVVDADSRTYGGIGLRVVPGQRAMLLSPGLGIEIEERSGATTFVRTARPEAAFRALAGGPQWAVHDDRM